MIKRPASSGAMESMVDTAPASLDDRLSSLRAELKAWEHAFAAENGGRKADRQDIKKDGEIAAKYKTYSRLRASTSEKTAEDGSAAATEAGEKDTTRGKKRKPSSQNYAFATPRKSSKHSFSTPSKRSQQEAGPEHEHEQDQKPPPHPSQLDPYDSPSRVRTLFTPSQRQNRISSESSPVQLRSAIGPTPQRDGKVLGLFDLLSASRKSSVTAATPSGSARKRKFADVETPSRSKGVKAQENAAEHGEDDGLPYTPSIQRSGNRALRTRRHSLTPVSTGKKFYLSKFFATPTVTRFAPIPEENEKSANATPKDTQGQNARATPSKRKPELETPSFLRRRNLFSSGRAGKNDEEKANSQLSPSAVRMPPRVMGKGLSTLVKGLRDMEDQRMDDDMDVLREIEEEQANNEDAGNVHVEDSQHPQGPGTGYAGYGGQGSPSKSQTQNKWKKPSQKRTTRLVTMRPSRARPKPQPKDIWEVESEDEPATSAAPKSQDPASQNGESGKPDEADRSEPQDPGFNGNDDGRDHDGTGDDEFTPGESLFHAISKSRKQRHNAVKGNKEAESKPDTETSKAKTKGGPKKVKAEAHANYRALKIRGRGGGGGGGGKGRFGGRFRGRR